jgi:hypothetical protein
MSVCAAPTCSHQSFDGSSYYVDVDVSSVELFNDIREWLENKYIEKYLSMEILLTR